MVVGGSRGKYFHELVLDAEKPFTEILDEYHEFVEFADAKEQKIEAAVRFFSILFAIIFTFYNFAFYDFKIQ